MRTVLLFAVLSSAAAAKKCRSNFYSAKSESTCSELSGGSGSDNGSFGSDDGSSDDIFKLFTRGGASGMSKCMATKFVGETECPQKSSYAAANEFCESKGMELCSVKEIFDFEDKLSTADKDLCGLRTSSASWWTSDRAQVSNNARQGWARVSKFNTMPANTAQNGVGPVVCCAENSGPRCLRCPGNTVAPAGSTSVQDCVAPPLMTINIWPDSSKNGRSDTVDAFIDDLSIGEFMADYEENLATKLRTCAAGSYSSRSAVSCAEGKISNGYQVKEGGVVSNGDKGANIWWKANSKTDVCSKSQFVTNKQCTGSVVWSDAKAVCAANSARLCTMEEISDGATAGTGCSARVWTQTPCTLPDGEAGFFAMNSKQRSGRDGLACMAPSRRSARPTCCSSDSQVFTAFAMCKTCPSGYTSRAGAVGQDECFPAPQTKCYLPEDYLGGSMKPCAQLDGFKVLNPALSNPADGLVCAGTPSGKCRTSSRARAIQLCANVGARLCTPKEFAQDVMMDLKEGICKPSAWYWTSGHALTRGAGVLARGNGAELKEMAVKRKGGIMCCADEGTGDTSDGYYCASCPNGNNGAINGANGFNDGIEDCLPGEGYYRAYDSGYELEFIEPDVADCPRNQYVAFTPKTCTEFGGTASAYARLGADAQTCAVPGVPCGKKVAKAEASEQCSKIGARLCTPDELESGEGERAGCRLKSKPVWTAQECNQGAGFVTRSSKKGDGKPQCSDSTAPVAAVMCCADTEAHCKSCPAGTATAGATNDGGFEECGCNSPKVFGPNGCDLPTVYVEMGSGKRAEETVFNLNLASTTVGTLKALISEWSKIETSTLVLFFKSNNEEITAANSASLSSIDVLDLSTIRAVKTCKSFYDKSGLYQKYTCGDNVCEAGKYLSGSAQSCTSLGLDVKTQAGEDTVQNGIVGGFLRDRQSGDYFCGTAYDYDDDKCMPTEMTFFQAKNYCEGKGMRTCGTQEIISNIPADRTSISSQCWGSDQKTKLFWSHKPCGEDNNANGEGDGFLDRRMQSYSGRRIKYYAQATDNDNKENDNVNTQSKCLAGDDDATETAQVACCADDTPVDTQYCRNCPANSCSDNQENKPCPEGATSNIDCICDTEYQEYWFFNQAIDREAKKISRPVCNNPITKSPTTAPPTPAPTAMIIYLYCVNSNSAQTLEVTSSDTIDSVKTRVSSLCPGSTPANELLIEKVSGDGPKKSGCDGGSGMFPGVDGCADFLDCDDKANCNKKTLSDEGIVHRNTIVCLGTAAPTSLSPTEAPTPKPLEDGIYVCDHINFANPTKDSGSESGCYFIGVDTDSISFNNKATKCSTDLGEQINFHIAGDKQKVVTSQGGEWRLTCDDCDFSNKAMASAPDEVLVCTAQTALYWNQAGKNMGVRNGNTLHLWPWTYCPTDTYRWGSRLPCNDNSIPWTGGAQTSANWGPYNAADGNKQCRGWCKPSGSSVSQEYDTAKCKASGNYKSPLNTKICATSGIGVHTEANPGATIDELCSGRSTWSQARDYCNARGWRLCTAEELQLSCTERTGCDYDYTFTWSKDKCTTKQGEAGHITSPADQRKWFYRALRNSYQGGGGFGCGVAPPAAETGNFLFENPSFDPYFGDGEWQPWYTDVTENTGMWAYYVESNQRFPYYYCDAFDTAGLSGTQFVNGVDIKGTSAGVYNLATHTSEVYGDYGLGDPTAGVAQKSPYPSMFFNLFGEAMGFSMTAESRKIQEFDGAAILYTSSDRTIDLSGDDFDAYGQFCAPDDTQVFVRCCADYDGSQCRACPAGKTRTRGSEDFDDFGAWKGKRDGVTNWGSQTCS